MFRLFFLILTASIFSLTTATAADKPAPKLVTQLDLAQKLIDALGFGEGLPEKPLENDYFEILGGNRTFKFEAEDTFDKQSDPVTIRNYPLFGAFSGKGWLHGTTSPVAVHFKIFIPVSGKYNLTVVSRGDDQLWSIAGRAFKLNSGANFKESTLGQLFITAGELEFNAIIPTAGAIDCFSFTAPNYTPLEPLAGWNPAAPLAAGALNEVIASLFGLEPLLPDDPSYKSWRIEAASLTKLPETVQITENQVHGKSLAAKWVRAFQTGGTVIVPLEAESTSVYRIRVRAEGSRIVAGFGKQTVTAALKPQLDWADLGTFRLTKGLHSLELQLPPTGGIDLIEVTRKLTSPADYATVTKSELKSNALVTAAELDAIIKSLQGQFKERK